MTRTEEYLALVRRMRDPRSKALASVFYVDRAAGRSVRDRRNAGYDRCNYRLGSLNNG